MESRIAKYRATIAVMLACVMVALAALGTFGVKEAHANESTPSQATSSQYDDEPFIGGDTIINIQMLRHDVTLNAGAGSGEDIVTQVDDGGTYIVPNCSFTSETQRFTYWTLDSAGSTTPIHPGETLTITEPKTLYAQWIDYDAVAMPVTGLDDTKLIWIAAVGLIVVGAVVTAVGTSRSRKRAGR